MSSKCARPPDYLGLLVLILPGFVGLNRLLKNSPLWVAFPRSCCYNLSP
jgi:hypothetical protein